MRPNLLDGDPYIGPPLTPKAVSTDRTGAFAGGDCVDFVEKIGLIDPKCVADEAMVRKIRELPREVGVMLVSVGAFGVVLPGIMGAPALVAGGLVLWPKAFGRVEGWFERRYPKLHHDSMKQIGRYLNDLERRYPHRELTASVTCD